MKYNAACSGMLHAAIVMSQRPHARIHVDTAAASQVRDRLSRLQTAGPSSRCGDHDAELLALKCTCLAKQCRAFIVAR